MTQPRTGQPESRVSVVDCFFHNGNEWSEEDKKRYREWLSRMPADHPSKSDPEPWSDHMTQPSPEDDLPPGPWFVGSLPPPEWRYICGANGNVIAAVAEWDKDGNLIQEFGGAKQAKAIARAIAAIPEMKEHNAFLQERVIAFQNEATRLRAEKAEIIRSLNDRLDIRLNNYLCEMKEGYDDSITGFNEAWDVMRKIFDEILTKTANETEGK